MSGVIAFSKVDAPVQALAAKAEYKVQWGTLHEKKYLPLKKRHAVLTGCALTISGPLTCVWGWDR